MFGSPSPPLPAHAYRPPNAEQPPQAFTPPTATPPQFAAVMPVDAPTADPREAILSEWRAHHGDAWVRSDGLHPQVRQLIDPQERTAAIRQRVWKLSNMQVGGGLRMESQVVGNPIRHWLYRVVADRP
jgi:hypothetical protein